MEEDIRILEEFIKDYEAVTDPLEKSSYYEEVPIISIKSLLNKYKEQEAMIHELRMETAKLENENQIVKGANEYWTMRFCEATNKKTEQEKIIELYEKGERFSQKQLEKIKDIVNETAAEFLKM